MKCPQCHRPTTPRRNGEGAPNKPEPGTVLATLANGTCFACYNRIRGWVRPRRSKSITFAPEIEYLPPRFTPEQVKEQEAAGDRRWLDRYVSDRRRRGVNVLGASTRTLYNGGAYLQDVK